MGLAGPATQKMYRSAARIKCFAWRYKRRNGEYMFSETRIRLRLDHETVRRALCALKDRALFQWVAEYAARFFPATLNNRDTLHATTSMRAGRQNSARANPAPERHGAS
jgi:hypothetical protein